MTSLTIRELRQHWPAAEKALELEEEILITRDGKPVAKLMRLPETEQRRTRFDPERHIARMRRILGRKNPPSIEERLTAHRADRRTS